MKRLPEEPASFGKLHLLHRLNPNVPHFSSERINDIIHSCRGVQKQLKSIRNMFDQPYSLKNLDQDHFTRMKTLNFRVDKLRLKKNIEPDEKENTGKNSARVVTFESLASREMTGILRDEKRPFGKISSIESVPKMRQKNKLHTLNRQPEYLVDEEYFKSISSKDLQFTMNLRKEQGYLNSRALGQCRYKNNPIRRSVLTHYTKNNDAIYTNRYSSRQEYK